MPPQACSIQLDGGHTTRPHHLLTLCLLQQIVTPVGHVEYGKDGGKDDSGDDVDLLGPGGELVEPGLEEVPLFLRLHVDLALVQLRGGHHHVVARTPHQGLQMKEREFVLNTQQAINNVRVFFFPKNALILDYWPQYKHIHNKQTDITVVHKVN